jgi:hypothetical protein
MMDAAAGRISARYVDLVTGESWNANSSCSSRCSGFVCSAFFCCYLTDVPSATWRAI